MKIPLPFVAAVVAIPLLYGAGYLAGSRAVEAERTADRAAQALIVAKLNGEIEQKEKQHVFETQQISTQFKDREAAYVAELATVRSEYVDGLRLSEQRAARYLALADSGTDQCRSLASYAARLDGSIVEGQSVVKELRSLVELRDAQLKLIGDQLLSDRQLYENYGNDRN